MSIPPKQRISLRSGFFLEDAFVEIEHPFGERKKSVFSIYEYDEFGLSFLIPDNEGYFLTDTPLKMTIIHVAEKIRRCCFGIVRYNHPWYKETGEKFNKTGVQIRQDYRDIGDRNQRIRSKRFSANEEKIIQFSLNDNSYTFPVADFGKYNAAFYCSSEKLIHFSLDKVLNKVVIWIGKDLIFEGSALIIKIYRDSRKKNRVVIQPRQKLINTGVIEKKSNKKTVQKELVDILKKHNDIHTTVSSKWKEDVSSFRLLLKDLKNHFESPRFQVSEEEQIDICKSLLPDFLPQIEGHIYNLDDIVRETALHNNAHGAYKEIFQKSLNPYFLAAPLIQRCYSKPLGYAGDFEMMRLNHINSYDGTTLFSKLINKYTTECKLGVVGRERTKYLKNFLKRVISKRSGSKMDILSVASGPAMEIQELIKEDAAQSNAINLALLDREILALNYALNSIYELKVKHVSLLELSCVHSSIQDFLIRFRKKNKKKHFDIIYSIGLFDYFDETIARFVIRGLIKMLKPEGILLIANVSMDNNKYRSFLEFSMDWYLVYRSVGDMARLAEKLRVKNYSVNEIQGGMMKFLEIKN